MRRPGNIVAVLAAVCCVVLVARILLSGRNTVSPVADEPTTVREGGAPTLSGGAGVHPRRATTAETGDARLGTEGTQDSVGVAPAGRASYVRGMVAHADGGPVAGAAVSLTAGGARGGAVLQTVLSDEAGRFSFEVEEAHRVTVVVRTGADRSRIWKREGVVAPCELTILLKGRAGGLEVHIPADASVPEASLELLYCPKGMDAFPVATQAVTTGRTVFRFDELELGRYTVVLRGPMSGHVSGLVFPSAITELRVRVAEVRLVPGTVVSASSGLPVADCQVESVGPWFVTKTDDSGRFLVPIARPQSVSFVVSKPGYAQGHVRVSWEAEGVSIALDVERAASVCVESGEVVLSRDSGIEVQLFAEAHLGNDGPSETTHRALTDARQCAIFRGLRPEVGYQIVAIHSNPAAVGFGRLGPGESSATVSMSAGVYIRGIVWDPGGLPVADALVELANNVGQASVRGGVPAAPGPRTGPAGRFATFTDVAGEFSLLVPRMDLIRIVGSEFSFVPGSLEIPLGDVSARQVLRLVAAEHVSGRLVRDAGEGVPNALVVAQYEGGKSVGTSDAAGYFDVFPVPVHQAVTLGAWSGDLESGSLSLGSRRRLGDVPMRRAVSAPENSPGGAVPAPR